MPYIKSWQRMDLAAGKVEPQTAGELNFVLTGIIRAYWLTRPNYQSINDIVGALDGTKLEFYRRVAAPYEDAKIKENGDVY